MSFRFDEKVAVVTGGANCTRRPFLAPPEIFKKRLLTNFRAALYRLGALLAVSIVFANHGRAQAKNGVHKVFVIGDFDRSSKEFAAGNPTSQVNFLVSHSNPAKDWYANHPAALAEPGASSSTSNTSAARAITFSLEKDPEVSYRLHISLLFESTSVPILRVSVNGKSGTIYPRPRLDYTSGDQMAAFYPTYSWADTSVVFPGKLLRKGTNTITLQPIEDASEAVPDAGVTYDAIELESARDSKVFGSERVQILPTVFFVREAGELREIVDAYLSHREPIAENKHIELEVGAKRYVATLASKADFGAERVQFKVAEFANGTTGILTANIDGHRVRYSQSINPQKKWTLALVPHTHVDIGYSDYQPKIAAIQSRTIDEAMTMISTHPEFKFSLDGEWDLEQYLQTHSPSQIQRAVDAIEKQQLFVPAQYANLLTGLPTTETLIRSLYPSLDLSLKHHTPLDYANITDVPSYSWSYPSILASAGISYLAAASNNYRAPVLLQGKLNEASPMWWVGPDNKKVLLWYSRIYQQMQMLFGLPPLISAGRETIPVFLQMYEHPSYLADTVILYGTQVENTDLFPQQAALAGKWNDIYAFPHIEYSGFHAAMERIQKQFGDSMPTISGDGGPYWEDGAASDAYFMALERQSEARAQTAEKLATLTALTNPELKVDTVELGRMWKDIVLMDEHTWGSYNSTSDPTSMQAVDQLAYKDKFAQDAATRVDSITRRAMADIVNGVSAKTGSVVVFNTLNWRRSGEVSIDMGKDQEIVDLTTEAVVPAELLLTGPNFIRVRFHAENVPAVGYKVYALRSAGKESLAASSIGGTTLENTYYKVQLDPETGAIRSIFDKELGRELVDQGAPYRFGQYLYVTGGDKSPNTILQYSKVYPKPDLQVCPSSEGKVSSITHTAGGEVAKVEYAGKNAKSIKAEIRLFDHEKKIEIVEEVDKEAVLAKEAVYFAFPFAMQHPQFQYEVQTGVVDPAKNMYAGAGHEWFSVQHWASVQQAGISGSVMPLDAPLVTFGDINRGEWPETFGQRPGTIFSYVMNNYWDTNYRASQGGYFKFRYVITSAPSTDMKYLSRRGWEEMTPLETDIVTSQDKALAQTSSPGGDAHTTEAQSLADYYHVPRLDGKQNGFVDMDDANVLLQTWKVAEDGNGTVMRFSDLGGKDRSVAVQLRGIQISRAWKTDALERGNEEVPVSGNRFQFQIHPHEIVTIRIAGDK